MDRFQQPVSLFIVRAVEVNIRILGIQRNQIALQQAVQNFYCNVVAHIERACHLFRGPRLRLAIEEQQQSFELGNAVDLLEDEPVDL